MHSDGFFNENVCEKNTIRNLFDLGVLLKIYFSISKFNQESGISNIHW